MMNECFYTVVIYDLARDRIDYEYDRQYSRLDDARAVANAHSGDDDFVALVARYDFDDLTVSYV